ncbi:MULTISPECIES: DUF2274 domain-containing protein [Nitrobacteraceae]|nr:MULTISPECIES: DUF2274 domain-containing protein [Nitrobacteraceae]
MLARFMATDRSFFEGSPSASFR